MYYHTETSLIEHNNICAKFIELFKTALLNRSCMLIAQYSTTETLALISRLPGKYLFTLNEFAW